MQSDRLSSSLSIVYFICSLVLAIGVPLDFYRMATIQGESFGLQNPLSLIFLGLAVTVGLLPLAIGFSLRGRDIARWHIQRRDNFFLSRPVVVMKLSELERNRNHATPPPKPVIGPGFIYVMRRADGVYKIGRSTYPAARLSEHAQDYGQAFTLVKWFAVPDMAAFERMALRMTREYAYKKEAGRRELRRMTKKQLTQFMVEFERMTNG